MEVVKYSTTLGTIYKIRLPVEFDAKFMEKFIKYVPVVGIINTPLEGVENCTLAIELVNIVTNVFNALEIDCVVLSGTLYSIYG